MGLGPVVLSLYRQLKTLGIFDSIDSVVELGSQGVWCPNRTLLVGLFEAFGRPVPSEKELSLYRSDSGIGRAPSRHLHEQLGFKYDCVDIDGNFGALTLDINFDPVPPAYRGKYGLTTNYGTTEHVLNQYNAFKMMHDFTAPRGYMLHALPFTVHLEHGFFNYQPNLFDALAHFNSYKTLGVWIGPDWTLSSLVPWERRLLDFMTLNPRPRICLSCCNRNCTTPSSACLCRASMKAAYPPRGVALPARGRRGIHKGERFRHVATEDERRHSSSRRIPSRFIATHLVNRVLRPLKLYQRPITD